MAVCAGISERAWRGCGASGALAGADPPAGERRTGIGGLGFGANWLRFTWDPKHDQTAEGAGGESAGDDRGRSRRCKRFNKLPPARYPADQWVVAKALFRVLSRALVELQMVFAERGECDFAEPALVARAALRQEHGVEGYEAAMGSELRHLLVDEMQDTSTSQYELIELLTEGWESEGKTVFLVGDPKQSIYLFRQARVERFVATMQTERMGELRLGRLRLTANFRSQAGLVEGFNESFSELFPRSAGRCAVCGGGGGCGAGLRGLDGTRARRGWHGMAALAEGSAEEITETKRAGAQEECDGRCGRLRSAGGIGRCLRGGRSRGRSRCWCGRGGSLG